MDGKLQSTVAGLPPDPHTGRFSKQRKHLNWDNFKIGLVIPPSKANKLRSVRTLTGTKLMPVGFEIKEKSNLLGGTSEDKINEWYKQHMERKFGHIDPIKDAIEKHGYIRTLKEGDLYYPEYRLLSQSVKRKYFRRNAALAIDNFADIIGEDLANLMDKLQAM